MELTQLIELLNLLETEGCLINTKPVTGTGDLFTGETVVNGTQTRLHFLLPINFPRALPYIYLDKGSEFEGLPHVLPLNLPANLPADLPIEWPTNFVCYHTSEGIILDENNPTEIIRWAIKKAVNLLEDGISGANHGDYADEFEVYWGYISNKSVINLVSSITKSQEVKVFKNSQKVYLAKSALVVSKYLHFDINKIPQKFPTIEDAILYVLPIGTQIIPPCSKDPFWSANELRQLVQPALDLLTPKQYRQYIKMNKAIAGTMLFALPRPSGGYSLFGVSYNSPEGYHPFLESGNKANLYPLKVSREEASYVLPRGGGKVNMTTKKVLLIGCGSVGGHVAHELVRAGLMNLTVVDSDKMSLDNTFRHVLGNAYAGRPKATALQEELRRKFPYVNIVSVDSTIEESINNGSIRFEAFDIVISALGSPTTEIWINQQLKGKVPGLFGWVEPLGIGGHALLALPTTPGCFKCLYSSTDQDDFLVNRAAFAEKNQWFGKSLSGCGQLYTPYGSLDALRSATLIVQLALDYLTGKELQSNLISWKGDDTDFLKQGYKLSNRFNVSEEKLNNNRYLFATALCSVCGNSAN